MATKQQQARPKTVLQQNKNDASKNGGLPEQLQPEEDQIVSTYLESMPGQSNARMMRQANILHLQQRQGNGYVQRLLAQRQVEQRSGPTEDEKAAALAQAGTAEGQASQVSEKGRQETAKSKESKNQAQEKGKIAKQKAGQPAGEKGSKQALESKSKAAAEDKAGKKPERQLAESKQADVGSEAVGVNGTGPGGHAPASPEEDPGFQKMKSRVKKVAQHEEKHEPSGYKANQAQGAAESPASELESKAQANQVGELQQAETPSFDAAAFKAQLMQRLQSMAPKSAKEADEFKQSNKAGILKNEMKGKVAQEEDKSKKPMEEKSAQPPNSGGTEPKSVTPLPEPQAGPPPEQVGAQEAVPKKKGKGEVEAPLEENSKGLDQKLKDADVSGKQLANSNEPEFQGALDAKKGAQEHAKTAPAEYRQAEQEQITQAQGEAANIAEEKTQGMHSEREQIIGQVAGDQIKTKGEDEKKRQQVAGEIQKIYQRTKTGVEKILGDLDNKVNQTFDQGAEAAKQVFENYVDSKMQAYKQRRYGGMLGWARWAKDKLLGMPSEVNAFYQQGRNLYLQKMDAVIDNVASIISTALSEAKAEVAKGKQEIQDYVNQLPAELQEVGQQASEEIQGKFDQLEQQIDEKRENLINHLAEKYQQNLQAIDSRIEELKAANKGLVQKAADAIGGAIKTILQLKEMLLSVLARAASAISNIIKDPIGFLGNLISGIKAGLQGFLSNIGKHLKKGLMSWLFGALGEAGIELPESFDIKGILTLVMQVLGLTWENLRTKAVKLFGEQVVGYLEKTFEIFAIIKDQGIGGLWEFVKDKLVSLKDTIFDAINDMVITQVIKAGIQWLVGILGGPAGAFIKAAKAIYDIVMWFVSNGQKLASLVQAILQSITAIASGAVSQAAQFIENSLAKAVPMVISFLASLLGLGGLGEKIKGIIKKVQGPVNRVIDWVLGKAKIVAAKVGGKLGLSDKKESGEGEAKKVYDSKDKQAAITAIKTEEAKSAKNGAVSKEDALKAAQKAKKQHPVLERIQVVDGGDSWDYDYVFRETLVTKIKKLFKRDPESKIQGEISRLTREFEARCDRDIAKYHDDPGEAARAVGRQYDQLQRRNPAQRIRDGQLPGFTKELKELPQPEREKLADEFQAKIDKIYRDRKLTASQVGVKVVKTPGAGYGARPLSGPPARKPKRYGGLGSDEWL